MKLRYVVSVASVLSAVLSFNGLQEARANVADDLTANYNKIVDNCGGANSPAYECSGNLIRLTGPASGYHVWDPSPNSRENKGVSFTYLRKDISVKLLFDEKTSGIIYYPSMSAPLDKGKAQVSCVYPADAWSWFQSRPYACGPTKKYPNDSGSCQEQGIYTADQWYQHFVSVPLGDEVFQHQCGFTMGDTEPNSAAAFNANLESINKIYNQKIGEKQENKYNEIIIKTWPVDATDKIPNPDKLPIQAFFYSIKDSGNGLVNARSYQKDYFSVTGLIVPIVKIDISDPANISFSYNSEDQEITVADELNANYNKVVNDCGSKDAPAYQCSGVLARIVSYPGSNYHVWDPSAKSIQTDGLSFGYFRKDIHFKNFMNEGRNSGFIYYPSKKAPQGVENTKVSCVFPAVGISDNRPYGKCGGSVTYPQTSGGCQAQGIYTAEDWYKHFSSFNGDKFQHQCGFDVSNCGHDTAKAFSESIKARNLVYNDNMPTTPAGSNEVIVRTQETDVNGKTVNPEKLPLQAFFYNNAAGLTEAKAYQQDYYNSTGKTVPVVYMNTSDFNNITFEYKTTDQVDLKKKLISPNN